MLNDVEWVSSQHDLGSDTAAIRFLDTATSTRAWNWADQGPFSLGAALPQPVVNGGS